MSRSAADMSFCTLGMLIIDEIRYLPPKPPAYDILGGAGTFAALGARLFAPPEAAGAVGWTIHRGNDFPKALSEEINSWQTGVQWIETPERQTTRALNEYIADKGEEFRAFKYTTAKIRIDETHLTDEMLAVKSFHMVCSPERYISLREGIRSRRAALGIHEDPFFVWEPVPDACVQIWAEMSALFAEDEIEEIQFDKLEERCAAILNCAATVGGDSAVIVRCGSKGCYIRSREDRRMLPAFWPADVAKEKVIDPTGAGNMFLGGLCIGLQSPEPQYLSKWTRGAIFGTIAASFAVEQVGVPKLSKSSIGDFWNNDTVERRIREYMARIDVALNRRD